MKIRPFDAERDYPAITRLFNVNFPESAESESEQRYHDFYRDPNHHFARFVTEDDGQVVACASWSQTVSRYHPKHFHVEVFVMPEYQGQGIGSTLWDYLNKELAKLQPEKIRTWTRESQPRAPRFFMDRGFQEENREVESWLDINAFDASRFSGAIEHVEAQGIRLTTLGELDSANPDMRRKLYELSTEIQRDIPGSEPATPVPYDVWAKRFDQPNYLPEGQFIALDGDKMVGASMLWGRQADNDLQTGTTGVLRSHRRRGIALALKLKAIEFARQRKASIIRTGNAATNVGMLSINRDLGFVPQPAWVIYVKTLVEAAE
ncbi:MAG: GNAT family N-acetyltransferase [Armatimonas sp.]